MSGPGIAPKIETSLFFMRADKNDLLYNTTYRYEGFADSEEAQLVGNVLNYYDQCDGDTVAQLCKNPLFKYLDNDVRITFIIHFLITSWLKKHWGSVSVSGFPRYWEAYQHYRILSIYISWRLVPKSFGVRDSTMPDGLSALHLLGLPRAT